MTPAAPHTSPPLPPPISTRIPPLLLGTATFNNQYNTSPHSLPTLSIVFHALHSGLLAFDTSPYYGPAESLLGAALTHPIIAPTFPRSSYFLTTKVGRIASNVFDYSPGWIDKSIHRSIQRLHSDSDSAEGYLDLALCHDAEFVSREEVLGAVTALRRLRAQNKVKYIGISGYPVDTLYSLAQYILDATGEPLDAVMSYANFTVQNATLAGAAVEKFPRAKVGVLLNASPLGMGLLRKNGVPVGSLGDWHPAPPGLREACARAAEYCEKEGDSAGAGGLASIAVRYAFEEWMAVGRRAGMGTIVPFGKRQDELEEEEDEEDEEEGGKGTEDEEKAEKGEVVMKGVSVCGVSYLEELKDTLGVYKSILAAAEQGEGSEEDVRKKEEVFRIVQELRGSVLGREWVDYAWESPGPDFVRGEVQPEKVEVEI